jgi:hypothetical protein
LEASSNAGSDYMIANFEKSRFGSSDWQGHLMDMWDWAIHIKPKMEIPY